ncbi:MAG: hypothetical protein COU11_03605 [Candidatus Harrisonbacteria bacterium CG10_big_fil_rev_8_21_14_0_10_49_15]|uniref:Uncharacterized protein n=1 Tax=Candidatus Harrisonbacteria bacterium CG10_big_fil_rev_8_21_14_0_10_49_15 TaxID=1974587 RepID=A0A2H0UKI0_9BACT|nr:MAG: hypothetical protein COU11_03605 [Candidatus Harrisonbacteria bacterium CG10_big_fil_rev_8_21_14_0_10_49_15]
MKKLLIIAGQEGVGKSTLTKALLPELENGAAFDAENILQVNPFVFGPEFKDLAIANSMALVYNFFEHGYERVVAASFINGQDGYERLKPKLKHNPKILVLQLTASQEVRDKRRIEREKPTTKEWRDIVDAVREKPFDKEDPGYTYAEIDNSELTVDETVVMIKERMVDFFE